MKLIFVIDSLGSGGAQRLLVNLVNSLSSDFSIAILLYNPKVDFFSGNLNSDLQLIKLKVQDHSGFSLDKLVSICRIISNYDIVISFLPAANIYVSLARIFVRSIYHISCEFSVVHSGESRLRRTLANIACILSSFVVTNSYTQSAYIQSLPFMSKKVSTIWNGIYPSSFSKPSSPIKPKILIPARISSPKNGVRLVRALNLFYHRNGYLPHVSWAGRQDSDVLSLRMRAEMNQLLASNALLNAHFSFLGEVSDINALYSEYPIVLLPSIYEGVPNVICEAMFSGSIVIASGVSDNTLILGDNCERGIVCDPLSPLSICIAIEKCLSLQQNEILSIISKARQFALQNFTVDSMSGKYLSLLRSLS